MNKDCTPVFTKKKCCKDIQVSKIETNEDINNVIFQENPCPGSLHIVQFEDSLVIYKYYNQIWNKIIDQEASTGTTGIKHQISDSEDDYSGQFPDVDGEVIGDTFTIQYSDGTVVHYRWDGTVWQDIFSEPEHYIQSVNNYTELRALDNYTPAAIVVNDWTYTGPDGNAYTTLGGIFKKVSTGAENGGTIIAGNYIWERDWDGINVQPEWWECGGFDRFGVSYVSKNTSGSWNIGYIDGIYSEADRLDNASRFITENNIQGKIQLQKRVYLVDRSINFTSTEGNGATIKHSRPYLVTNTVAYIAGQTTVTVSDASNFRVGQMVCLTDNSKPNGGVGYTENFYLIGNPNVSIISITGNVITLSESPTQSVPIGNSFAAAPMMGTINTNSLIESVTFDGNGQTNTNTVDFRFTHFLGNGGQLPTKGGEHMIVFNSCRFDNIVGTAFVGANFKIISCAASNIGGGIFHYGGLGTTVTGLYHNCQVDGLQGSNMGYIDPYISFHQEALFTFSTNAKNITINNVNIFGLKNAVFGIASEGHHTFELSNSTFEGERPTWASSTKPHLLGKFRVGFNTPFNQEDQQRVFRISNCSFNTCGDLVFEGQNIANGENISNVVINNNRFNNVRIGAYSTSNITITNNKFSNISFGGHTTYTYALPLFIPFISTAQIAANRCDRVNISNNILEGQEVYSDFLDYGIQTQMHQIFRETSAGVNTKTWYSSNIKINNNTVNRYSFGIGNIQRYDDALSTWNSGHPNWGDGVHVGCEINNNIIQFHKDSQYLNAFHPIWGIMALPGVDVKNNKIYHPLNAPVNPVRSIMVWGINNAHRDELMGSTIENNMVWSPSGIINIIIGTGAGGDGMEDNVVIKGNGLVGTIYGLNAYQTGNYNILTVFPHLTSPRMNPDLSGWMQNISQY